MHSFTFTSCVLFSILCQTVVIQSRSLSTNPTHRSDVKHFESQLDTTTGYWSPSTSSIDWCERNYVVTEYIAEFWNCISSLLMCVFAGILFIQALYNRLDHRFLLLCFSFGTVGLGSAFFHGTLTHLGQMADELPMVYTMIVWWVILYRMDHFKRIQDNTYKIDWAVVFGILYAVLWTYIHSLQTFVIIFQVHFTFMVLGGITKLVFIYQQTQHHMKSVKYLIIVYVGLLFPALTCWLIDQHFCEQLNREGGFNPQLHAWWHLICAVDAHVGIVCGEALRLLSTKYHQHQTKQRTKFPAKPFVPNEHLHIVFHFGLPFIDYSNEKSTEQAKNK